MIVHTLTTHLVKNQERNTSLHDSTTQVICSFTENQNNESYAMYGTGNTVGRFAPKKRQIQLVERAHEQ